MGDQNSKNNIIKRLFTFLKSIWDLFVEEKTRKRKYDKKTDQLLTAIEQLKFQDNNALNKYHELTARSLDNVVHLTEYEDQKANRILSAIAFLSALSGILFSSLIPKYLDGTILLREHWNWAVWSYYITFALYIFILIMGVFIVIHALYPRFNNPPSWKKDNTKPGSYLFYEKIIEIKPNIWVNAFDNKTQDELLIEYIKGNIAESYIVSQKIGEKMLSLKPGVRLLNSAVLFLIPWIISCAIVVQCSPKIEGPDSPIKKEIQNSANKSADALKNADKAPQSVEDCLLYGRTTIISSSRLNAGLSHICRR